MTARARYCRTGTRRRLTVGRLVRWRTARQGRGFAFSAIMRLRATRTPAEWREFLAWKAAR